MRRRASIAQGHFRSESIELKIAETDVWSWLFPGTQPLFECRRSLWQPFASPQAQVGPSSPGSRIDKIELDKRTPHNLEQDDVKHPTVHHRQASPSQARHVGSVAQA